MNTQIKLIKKVLFFNPTRPWPAR